MDEAATNDQRLTAEILPALPRAACMKHEMGTCAAFWRQLLQAYGRWDLFEVVTLEAGYGSLGEATLIDPAGYGDVLGLLQ